MHWLDWLILLGTLGFIVGYGVWRTRRETGSESEQQETGGQEAGLAYRNSKRGVGNGQR